MKMYVWLNPSRIKYGSDFIVVAALVVAFGILGAGS